MSRATRSAVATSRICRLARPKTRQLEGGVRSPAVPVRHLPCRASAHIELLAGKSSHTPDLTSSNPTHVFVLPPSVPKHDPPRFQGDRSACWPVPRAARNCVASQRLLELSVPKKRTALFEGYDPYIVSQAARSASPSPRIQQLCRPLPRKCSTK